MDFRIQDPSWPDSFYLLEAMLEAAEHSVGGAAMFSFASPGGIRLLMGDKQFQTFLGKAHFDLIVGVDAVTNTVALDAIRAVAADYPFLRAQAFLDTSTQALFHAKVCWFRTPAGATWIVGSGNLTPGGLRGNVEAFSISSMALTEHESAEKRWKAWLAYHNGHLFPLDNADVVDRARQNTGRELPERRVKGLVQELLVEEPTGKIAVDALQSPDDAVLIAEIPAAGDRWNQANFDLATYQGFFGATPGRTERIFLTHVDALGNPGNEELRPSVEVRSRNFRFELEAAAGLPYPNPAQGRPIGIFLRLATRTFRYHLLMPSAPAHPLVSGYLRARVVSPPNRMLRLQTNVQELVALWPDCPVLKRP